MDIRFFARRHHEPAAQSSKSGGAGNAQTADAGQAAQAAQAAQPTAAASAPAAATSATPDAAERPATISRFTPAGRLLHALQSFEDRHPDEAKNILGNIADKLRSDAEHAGAFSDRLNKWADRFQEAADSGDMSKLMPRAPSHFGLRAYQQAEQPDPDATVEHVAGTAETAANATRPAAVSGEAAPESASSSTTQSSDARTQPVTVSESSKAEPSPDIRNRPVTVPESSTAERSSSDMRSRPVTVPESSKVSDTQ